MLDDPLMREGLARWADTLAREWVALLALMVGFAHPLVTGWLAVRVLPESFWRRRGVLEVLLVPRVFSVVAAVLLIAVLRWSGVAGLAAAGPWASLALDGLKLLGIVVVAMWLLRLRKAPDRIKQIVVCRPADVRLRRALVFGGFGDSTGVVTPTDLRRWFDGDLRYVDVLHVGELAGRAPGEAGMTRDRWLLEAGFKGFPEGDVLAPSSVPHLWQQPPRAIRRMLRRPDGRPELAIATTNRILNLGIPPELWEASKQLCRLTPSAVARSWKAFHFESTLRLRLVCLFNAADLLQRTVAAGVFGTLRARNRLHALVDGPLLQAGSFGDWNRTLHAVLARSDDGSVAWARNVLLRPRADAEDLLAVLDPFWRLFGTARPPAPAHTLGAWRVLGDVRNALLGHGVVGWQLALEPTRYLRALHRYFLAAARDVACMDLGVRAVRRKLERRLDVLGLDRGLSAGSSFEASSIPVLRRDGVAIPLSPFVRFEAGRVLFVNRIRAEWAEYVDYDAQNVTEPSFVTLPIGEAMFRSPASRPEPTG